MFKNPFVDFNKKVVIVTGASSGIGKAISVMLANNGAKLILIGRNLEKLQKVSEDINGTENKIVCLDLSRTDEISPAISKVSQEFGPIYGLCNVAGITEIIPLRNFEFSRIQKIIDVNLIASIELTRCVTKKNIIESEGGSILFISSISGIVGMPGVISYSASKGAIAAAARCMAVELARRNIRVNALSPGLVWTDMSRETFSKLPEDNVKKIENNHLLGVGTPEDVARGAVFLLAPQNKWITGIDLVIDGGYIVQ